MTQKLICLKCKKNGNPDKFFDLPYDLLIKEQENKTSSSDYYDQIKIHDLPLNPKIIHTVIERIISLNYLLIV